MTDGFAVDPGELLAYAAQLGQLAGQVGVANNAINTVINENSGKLGPVTDELTKLGITRTGQLDRAYGLICQPFGIGLQNMQQQAEKGIEQTMRLISTLAERLRTCAHNYEAADRTAAATIKKAGSGMDKLAPGPQIPASARSTIPPNPPLPPRMPEIPTLPNQDGRDV
jgi:hypothetical protein